jgi:flavorubredoxin
MKGEIKIMFISDSIKYVGVDDKDIDLFESQYVVPDGVSYNSYIIFDDKITIMDTVDARATEEWVKNVEEALDGKKPEYLVISHLEPDHAANIKLIADKYPDMKLIGNAKTFQMLPQFFDEDFSDRQVVVKEGDEISLGKHSLTFVMAPMVHWPEVMVAYEKTEKILFSADGFGKFGALDTEDEEGWACEARRYYFNIVGKYGAQVQNLLKKAAALDIQTICPLHGPVLKENLGYYLNLYNTWSSYEPEDEGVLVAYASIHGNTAKAAKQIAEKLKAKGVEKMEVMDLSRDDMAEAVEAAFRYDKMVLACATYDGGLFPVMEDFLGHLKAKNFQKRKAALVENGSWAPLAAKKMRESLESMKNIEICENTVSIKSTVKAENVEQMDKMIDELLGK